jgi:hypothetical protein
LAEDNPFEGYDTAASVMAYVHHITGMAGLIQLLDKLESDGAFLERAADELEAVGLKDVAAAVSDYAATAPPPSNPFDKLTDPANWRDWNRRHTGSFDGYYFDDIERGYVVASRLNK